MGFSFLNTCLRVYLLYLCKFVKNLNMTYNIVNVKLTHPSFSWANGLYAVIEINGTELRMCQIDKEGKPSLYDDGRFMITCTGTGNKEVHPTYLKLEYNGV